MVKLKVDNRDIIDAVFANEMTNIEMAQVIRQIYRRVEQKAPTEGGGDFTRAAILNALLAAADGIEEFL